MTRTLVATALAAAFALSAAAPARADDAHVLRIATLAPKNSAWGKVFKVWRKAVKKKSDGKLNLRVYYNAVQGDETSMVAKMRTGQLDGAVLTSLGLSTIYKQVLVMSLPGISDSWANLAKVRTALEPEILKGFDAEGFEIFGWGDIGLVRQMSKGFAIRRPDDLQGKRPLVWRNEPLGPLLYSFIPNVVPIPKSVTEVLPELRSGNVNVINAPALAAEQLQWIAYLDHVSSQVTTTAIGGTIFRKKALEGVPADLRTGFFELRDKMNKKSSKRVRKLDERSYERLAKKMTVVDQSDADRAEWEKLLRKAVKRLSQGTYDKEMVKKAALAVGRTLD